MDDQVRRQLIHAGHAAGGFGEPEILYDRHDVLVVRIGAVVAKSHQRSATGLNERLGTAVPGVLLPLLAPLTEIDGRTISVWPAGEPVNPEDPEGAPWEEGGRLLARLHATAPPRLPPQGAPARVIEVMTRLPAGHPASPVVRRAFATLPTPLETPGHRSLVHGDWHLGQLVRHEGAWHLIDLDELGVGDPAWDLARPAALFSAGVIAPAVWERFLNAYRDEGGSAVPPTGDPWSRLEIPARALAIQTAARCVSHAYEENRPLDDLELAVIDTCDRIGTLASSP